MGQTHSDLSSSAASSARAKWKNKERALGLRLCTFGSKSKPRRKQGNGNPVKSKVLSCCLGRGKRDSGHGEADIANAAADPARHRGHRAGELSRDEIVSAGVEHTGTPSVFETSSGLSDRVEVIQLAVNREPVPDAPGSEKRSQLISEESREDNAWDAPAKTMDEQPLKENNKEHIVLKSESFSGANLSLTPILTSDPDTERTLPPDQHLEGGLSITDSDNKMTKTEYSSRSCPTKTDDDQNNSLPTDTKTQKDSEIHQSSTGGHRFPGVIPKLVITSVCNSSWPQETEPGTGLLQNSHAGEQSPCSDSGCGGSPVQTRTSLASLSPLSSFDESEDPSDPDSPTTVNHWCTLKNVVRVVPLKKPYKIWKHWVQLAGHEGIFHKKTDGNVLKLYSESEHRCLQELMGDVLQPFVPQYLGVEELDGKKYNLIQDLLTGFDNPSIMDCKMGSRTYLEEELTKARSSPCLRKDMFEKMMSVDPEAPTLQERAEQGVIKLRYMQWRESLSSTKNLGFRIEGVMKCDGQRRKNFKKTKQKEDVVKVLKYFTGGCIPILRIYLERLEKLRSALEQSPFFRRHECVGTSLLFVHDASGRASVWMIDFGKTIPLPDFVTVDHRTPWAEGNKEDGYLWGLDNLVNILGDILSKTSLEGEKTQTNDEMDCQGENAELYTD
uniref:Kinase n=1 Tax=Nothobranchius kadleci TaxID=1051664 RepID=A0A1A8CW74_NOTKA